MGMPHLWGTVIGWLTFCGSTILQKMGVVGKKESKYPEIPVLKDYSKCPGEKFWENFPFRGIPSCPESRINVGELNDLLNEN